MQVKFIKSAGSYRKDRVYNIPNSLGKLMIQMRNAIAYSEPEAEVQTPPASARKAPAPAPSVPAPAPIPLPDPAGSAPIPLEAPAVIEPEGNPVTAVQTRAAAPEKEIVERQFNESPEKKVLTAEGSAPTRKKPGRKPKDKNQYQTKDISAKTE